MDSDSDHVDVDAQKEMPVVNGRIVSRFWFLFHYQRLVSDNHTYSRINILIIFPVSLWSLRLKYNLSGNISGVFTIRKGLELGLVTLVLLCFGGMESTGFHVASLNWTVYDRGMQDLQVNFTEAML